MLRIMIKILFLPILLFSPNVSFGQSIWLGEAPTSSASIEIYQPTMDTATAEGTSVGTTVWFFSGRTPFTPQVIGITELPLAFASFREYQGDLNVSSSTVGNPYLGLEIGDQETIYGEFGIRLPATQDDELVAQTIGGFADVDRSDAFTPHFVTLLGKVNFIAHESTGRFFRARAGSRLEVNTENSGDPAEVYFDVNLLTGYVTPTYRMIGGYALNLAASEGAKFSDRTLQQLGASVSFALGRTWPGVQLRVPLDQNVNDIIDFVIGLSLTLDLGQSAERSP